MKRKNVYGQWVDEGSAKGHFDNQNGMKGSMISMSAIYRPDKKEGDMRGKTRKKAI
jgi:hypothetical protein